MTLQRAKFLFVYLCLAKIFSISSGTSTTVDSSVVTTPGPMPTASTDVGLSFEMTIQPSSTSTSLDLLAQSSEIQIQYTSVVPSTGEEMPTTTSSMSIASISSTVTETPTPMTTDEFTSTISSTETITPEITTNTETDQATSKGGGADAQTTLLPINTEILALIGIGLGGASCLCTVLFSFGCILALACHQCKKSRANYKKEVQDSTFRSSTLQRPLGEAISENFAIKNPTFQDSKMSHEEEMTDMSTPNRRESTISALYSW